MRPVASQMPPISGTIDNNPPWSPNPTLPLFRKWRVRGGIIIDGNAWAERLALEPFDAIVYSVNGDLTMNCRRLLCTRYWGVQLPSCEVRLAGNVHTKLFLFQESGEVWAGSRNLVDDASYHNLMLRVGDAEQRKSLRLYFERLWSLAAL